MTLESFYLCVSVAYLPFQIILLWYLSVTGERMCTEYLSTAYEQGGKKNLLCPLLFSGGGGVTLGIILVRVCGLVF